MVTLKEVAKRAGVSIGTASAAINGATSVKEKTREIVKQVAAEMGYKKDASAAVLAGKRLSAKAAVKQISLAYVASKGEVAINTTWSCFQKHAEAFGYDAEKVYLHEYGTLRRAAEHLRFLNVQGLYLASPGCIPKPEWLEFNWGLFSVIKAFRVWPELKFAVIRHSATDYMRCALDEVIMRGYKRLGLIMNQSTAPRDDVSRLGTVLGYQQLFPEMGLEVEWRVCRAEQPQIPKEVAQWLRKYKPEAVIVFPGSLYFKLLEAGFEIPNTFGVAGVNERESFAHTYGVALCDSRDELFPERAVQLLHRMIRLGHRGHTEDPIESVIEPRWIDGPSLPYHKSNSN